MVYAFHDAVFHGVRKWSVPNIVQQDGDVQRLFFFVRNRNILEPQHLHGFLHQVHTAQRMVEPRMVRARIDQIRQTHLRNPSQSLEIFVLYQVIDQFVGQSDEAVNRVVENLEFIDLAHADGFGVQI